MPRLPALLLALALGPAALAQPEALDLRPTPGAYADALHVVGWSADGRRIAFLHGRSGQGATGTRYDVVVQDLATDVRVETLPLTGAEPDGEPDLPGLWRRYAREVGAVLDRHGIARGAAVRLRELPLPYAAPAGEPFLHLAELDYGVAEGYDGPIKMSTLTLYRGGPGTPLSEGRSKRVDTRVYEYGVYGYRVVGYLESPTADRIAIVVEEAPFGFEGVEARTYRLVGAGVGPRF